ncbi:unnamed protein product [Amoebophrya sp. A25]|nr:unnamed protein product [Amoebophrya sp. A25]|eukprot:GSA25T00015693001.1
MVNEKQNATEKDSDSNIISSSDAAVGGDGAPPNDEGRKEATARNTTCMKVTSSKLDSLITTDEGGPESEPDASLVNSSNGEPGEEVDGASTQVEMTIEELDGSAPSTSVDAAPQAQPPISSSSDDENTRIDQKVQVEDKDVVRDERDESSESGRDPGLSRSLEVLDASTTFLSSPTSTGENQEGSVTGAARDSSCTMSTSAPDEMSGMFMCPNGTSLFTPPQDFVWTDYQKHRMRVSAGDTAREQISKKISYILRHCHKPRSKVTALLSSCPHEHSGEDEHDCAASAGSPQGADACGGGGATSPLTIPSDTIAKSKADFDSSRAMSPLSSMAHFRDKQKDWMRAVDLLQYMTDPHDPKTVQDLVELLKRCNEEKVRYEIRGEDSVLEVRANRKAGSNDHISAQRRTKTAAKHPPKLVIIPKATPSTKSSKEIAGTIGTAAASTDAVNPSKEAGDRKGCGKNKGRTQKGERKTGAKTDDASSKKASTTATSPESGPASISTSASTTAQAPKNATVVLKEVDSRSAKSTAKKQPNAAGCLKKIDENLFFSKYGLDELARKKLHELDADKQQEAMRKFCPVRSIAAEDYAKVFMTYIKRYRPTQQDQETSPTSVIEGHIEGERNKQNRRASANNNSTSSTAGESNNGGTTSRTATANNTSKQKTDSNKEAGSSNAQTSGLWKPGLDFVPSSMLATGGADITIDKQTLQNLIGYNISLNETSSTTAKDASSAPARVLYYYGNRLYATGAPAATVAAANSAIAPAFTPTVAQQGPQVAVLYNSDGSSPQCYLVPTTTTTATPASNTTCSLLPGAASSALVAAASPGAPLAAGCAGQGGVAYYYAPSAVSAGQVATLQPSAAIGGAAGSPMYYYCPAAPGVTAGGTIVQVPSSTATSSSVYPVTTLPMAGQTYFHPPASSAYATSNTKGTTTTKGKPAAGKGGAFTAGKGGSGSAAFGATAGTGARHAWTSQTAGIKGGAAPPSRSGTAYAGKGAQFGKDGGGPSYYYGAATGAPPPVVYYNTTKGAAATQSKGAACAKGEGTYFSAKGSVGGYGGYYVYGSGSYYYYGSGAASAFNSKGTGKGAKATKGSANTAASSGETTTTTTASTPAPVTKTNTKEDANTPQSKQDSSTTSGARAKASSKSSKPKAAADPASVKATAKPSSNTASTTSEETTTTTSSSSGKRSSEESVTKDEVMPGLNPEAEAFQPATATA